MKPSCRPGAALEADRCPSFLDRSAATPHSGLAWAMAVVLIGGCATTRDIEQLQTTSQREPTNAQLKLKYMEERDRQVKDLLDGADRLRLIHDFDRAQVLLLQALRLDPGNERGRRIAAAIDVDRRNGAVLQEAERMMERGSYDGAAERVERVLAENRTMPAHCASTADQRSGVCKSRPPKRRTPRRRSCASRCRCSSGMPTCAWCSKRCRARRA